MFVSVAPVKALCSERYDDWKRRFGPLGLQCQELTGDTELDDYSLLQNVHIIFTTPVRLHLEYLLLYIFSPGSPSH